MKKYREKYLTSYVVARTVENQEFFRYIFKSYFLNSFYFIPFLFFGIQQPTSKICVSGNRNNKFFFSSDKNLLFGHWGVGSYRKNIELNIAKLYIVTFLYCFVSRRFVRLYRKTQLEYRAKVKGSPLKIVFVHSDALPLVRALISCLRPLKIKFICVQHGIFHQSIKNEIDGSRSDLNIVMNELQLSHFENSFVRNNIVYSNIENNTKRESGKEGSFNSVVLIGEGYFTVSKSTDNLIMGLYLNIKRVCRNEKIKCYYRPHPSEKRSFFVFLKLLIKFKFLELSSDVNNNSLYVGVYSSYLSVVTQNKGKAVRIDLSKCSNQQQVLDQAPIISIDDIYKAIKLRCVSINNDGLCLQDNYFYGAYDVSLILNSIKSAGQ